MATVLWLWLAAPAVRANPVWEIPPEEIQRREQQAAADRAAAERERAAERRQEAARQAEAERLRQEEVARAAAEAERRRAEEAARLAAAAEQRQREEQARQAADAERRRQEEAARLAAEEERTRQAAEAERRAAAAEAQRLAALEAAKPQLTYLVVDDGTATLDGELMVFAAMEQRSGVVVKPRAVPIAEYPARLATLAAAGSLPDLITAPRSFVAERGASLFLDYRSHLQRLPSLRQLLADYAELAVALRGTDGGQYALPAIDTRVRYEPVVGIRGDVLAELGLQPAPEQTPDDLLGLLKRARGSLGGSVSAPWQPIGAGNELLTITPLAFGTGGTDDVFWSGTQFLYAPATWEYQVYLRLLAASYLAGVLHRDAFTNDAATNRALFLQGRGAYYVRDELSMRGADREALIAATGRDSAVYAPTLPPVLGRRAHQPRRASTLLTDRVRAINRRSERIDDVMTYLDYAYSERGRTFLYWGAENEHWRRQDGLPQWLIPAPFASVAGASGPPARSLGLLDPWLVLVRPDTPDDPARGDLRRRLTRGRLGSLQAPRPDLYLTPAERAESDSLLADLAPFARAQAVLFATGRSNFSEQWAGFTADLRARGADRLVAIYNQAYRRASQ